MKFDSITSYKCVKPEAFSKLVTIKKVLHSYDIKLIICKSSRTIIWSQNDQINTFNNLPGIFYNLLKEVLENDEQAQVAFKVFFPDISEERRKVEFYVCHMWSKDSLLNY
ncbi:hypothetical protein D7030_13210 [Flavobacteriaceae bacterium AU392]|nr:hypothetical protein D1817_05280 [Flavobacteriaceae bacterium]RKM81261.1 hypothetical protein D7030_13210 [Flavobacteriaceae bacterium AU392]